jgi:hypothetical protein
MGIPEELSSHLYPIVTQNHITQFGKNDAFQFTQFSSFETQCFGRTIFGPA